MTGLNHVLTGAAIALVVKEPMLIAPLAFASHFVLDSVAHFGGHESYEYGHKHFPIIMFTDGILSATSIYAIMTFMPALAFPVALGGLMAILPDFFWLHYYKHNKPKHWFFNFHKKIQWSETPKGAINEAVYLAMIVFIILLLLGVGNIK